MFKKSDSSVRLFSYDDDQPREAKGSLIPRQGNSHFNENTTSTSFTPESVKGTTSTATKRIGFAVLAIFAFGLVGSSGYGVISSLGQSASPVVTLTGANTSEASTIEYGPQEALTNKSIFTDTRDAFIDEGLHFIEVDISQRQLRFFENGVLVQSAEVLATGQKGSWWETPSGLYKIEEKEKDAFSTTAQVNLPWRLTFQGNYAIHGWPTYPDEVPIDKDDAVGGIRLSNESAQALYQHAKEGMPVLVHADKTRPDDFVYQPQVLDVGAPHYFIADVENGTILAASDLNQSAPIASLVKLMTAVVATEEMSVDTKIRVTSPTFVTSLVPRLSGRGSVYLYNLLQLLLVESSNEAAETIAGEVGREEFMDKMNDKARQLGMLHTNFADPSGLSSDNEASLDDLYKLTKYIYENKSFIFDITDQTTAPTTYSEEEFAGLVNFNQLDGMDSFRGGKVGETMAAGKTSISLHELEIGGENRVLAIILLGAEDRTEDIATLLSYVQNRYGR